MNFTSDTDDGVDVDLCGIAASDKVIDRRFKIILNDMEGVNREYFLHIEVSIILLYNCNQLDILVGRLVQKISF